MGHGLKDCEIVLDEVKEMLEDALPYLVALKTESNLIGTECLKFGYGIKK